MARKPKGKLTVPLTYDEDVVARWRASLELYLDPYNLDLLTQRHLTNNFTLLWCDTCGGSLCHPAVREGYDYFFGACYYEGVYFCGYCDPIHRGGMPPVSDPDEE